MKFPPDDACPCDDDPVPHRHGPDGKVTERFPIFIRGSQEGSIRHKLLEFHYAMQVPALATPQVPDAERVRLRAKLILEECLEFIAATFRGEEAGELFQCARDDLESIVAAAPVRVDLVEAADALADIAYVVEGTNLEFGIDSGPVLDEVHRANMAKAGGARRADGKVLKPEGWTPPDVAGVLALQSQRHRLQR